jgi:general secretion pathway protein E
MTVQSKRVGDILVQKGAITQDQADQAETQAQRNGKKVGAVLIERGWVTPLVLAQALGELLKLPVVDLSKERVQPAALGLIPDDVARQMNVLPLTADAATLTIALEDPLRIEVIDNLRALTRRRIITVLAPYGSVQAAINQHYRLTSKIERQLAHALPSPGIQPAGGALAAEIANAPVVRAVDTIIEQAVRDRASDIHLEPETNHLRVRFRIDGILHEILQLPMSAHAPLISRIKVLANMNIAERRRPQGGQFSKRVGDREVDFRVATVETGRGEMLVLRVLDKRISFIPLSDLGLLPVPLALYRRMLETPLGMILVSGPTGSGKTTTLYASLQHLDAQELNVMTIEDPIEYHFDNINQIQVNSQADITFAAGLRAVMRLDPNVILVGEIRDRETARTAVQAALTGHLVLTTIHANDAASAILRLRDLDVEPFLISSVLVGSVAQRLVRRVCPHCHSTRPASAAETALYAECLGEERSEFVYGVGCNHCAQTGYYSRIGLFEVLPVSDAIRALLAADADVPKVRAQALREGMIPLRADGMLKVQAGITTPYEVMRNAFSLGDPDMLPPAG